MPLDARDGPRGHQDVFAGLRNGDGNLGARKASGRVVSRSLRQAEVFSAYPLGKGIARGVLGGSFIAYGRSMCGAWAISGMQRDPFWEAKAAG